MGEGSPHYDLSTPQNFSDSLRNDEHDKSGRRAAHQPAIHHTGHPRAGRPLWHPPIQTHGTENPPDTGRLPSGKICQRNPFPAAAGRIKHACLAKANAYMDRRQHHHWRRIPRRPPAARTPALARSGNPLRCP